MPHFGLPFANRVAAALIIGSLFAAPVRGQEVLTGDELEVLAQKVRNFTPRDEFDVPAQLPSVEGKRFTYTVTPLKRGSANKICDGFPSWGYWPEDQRLEVGASQSHGIKHDFAGATGRMFPSGEGLSDFRTMVSFHSFRCQYARLPSYEAVNGFGASVVVEKTREDVTAIGEFALPDTSWKTYWTTEVVGEKARQLSQNIRVRISGKLEDWATGRPVVCGRKKGRPDFSLPLDTDLRICMFNGKADLFEVIDAHSGAILFASRR